MNKCYDSYIKGLAEVEGIMEWVVKVEVMIKVHSLA